MDKQELSTKIEEWLLSQGYTLELRVATAFAKAGFRLSLANYYTDPASQITRQIDIVARFPNALGTFYFVFTIECKSSSKNPWILLTSEFSDDGYQPFFAHSFMTAETRSAATHMQEGFLNLPWARYGGTDGIGLVQAFKNGDDIAYKATMCALAATIATRKTFSGLGWEPYVFCVPAVVFDNDLYECSLGASGHASTKKIEGGRLFLPYPMGDELGGYIHIVPGSSLDEFADASWKAAKATSELFADLSKKKLESFL